jgi:predicted Zn finger-like uncharacterized protein
MKVTCQACSAQYTIADDKVRGRKVKIRCKACQNPIVVDGQMAAPEGQGDSAEGASQLESFPSDSPGAAEADVWNVNLSETDSRTMTTAELVEGYQSGAITSEAFVWKDGMGDWVPLLECAELAPLLGTAPAAAGAAPAQRAASAKAEPAADLFGDIDVAGGEEDEVDVATSARAFPTLPGSTAYDDKPTGQRNENSVLFSLDAMKAGFSPQPPPRKTNPEQAPRPAQASNPDDPFGMGASGGIAALGSGGNPLFNLNDNQALLTAPAPPAPEPKALSVPGLSVAAAPAYSEADAKKKRLFLFGGIGAGAVALIAAIALAMGGKKDESSTSAAPQTSADAKARASPEPEKVEKPAPDTETEPAPSAKTEEPKVEEPKPAEPEAAAAPGKPVAKGGGGSGAPAPKKEEPAPATASAPFSRSAAVSALGAAASQASACKKPGGPTGVGKVQVTFANSGRVTSASVSGGTFAGTAVGGCVAGAFRRAKVPPFSGNPVTVSKSFQIN